MKVRLLKDWNFHKTGDVVDVFEPIARNWLATGIAESPPERRDLEVERAESPVFESAERAVRRHPGKRR
jgi:ribosomal protein L9